MYIRVSFSDKNKLVDYNADSEDKHEPKPEV